MFIVLVVTPALNSSMQRLGDFPNPGCAEICWTPPRQRKAPPPEVQRFQLQQSNPRRSQGQFFKADLDIQDSLYLSETRPLLYAIATTPSL